VTIAPATSQYVTAGRTSPPLPTFSGIVGPGVTLESFVFEVGVVAGLPYVISCIMDPDVTLESLAFEGGAAAGLPYAINLRETNPGTDWVSGSVDSRRRIMGCSSVGAATQGHIL